MTLPTPAIRAAIAQDHVELSFTLVHAFQNDPLAIWLYPDPAERRRHHRDLFAQTLAEPGRGAVIDTSPECDAVAIWRPVDSPPGRAAPVGARPEAGDFFARIADASPKLPYWSLAFLGARVRGAGLGSALVRYRLARTSGDVALWTANASNLKFYEKFGFKVAREVDGLGVSAWWLAL